MKLVTIKGISLRKGWRMRIHRWWSYILGIGLILSGQAIAEQSGATLARSCLACHSHEGKTGSPIPVIKQMSAAEMYVQLKAFKEGAVSSTVMGRIAKGYSDKQLKAIAEFFAKGG